MKANYLSGKIQCPNGSAIPKFNLIIGLPNSTGNDYLSDDLNSHISIRNNYVSLFKRDDGSMCLLSMMNPINSTNSLWFIIYDDKYISEKKNGLAASEVKLYGRNDQGLKGVINYPNDMLRYENGVCVTTAFKTTETDRQKFFIYFDIVHNLIIDSDGKKYTLDEVLIAVRNQEIKTFEYSLNLIKLSDIDMFREKLLCDEELIISKSTLNYSIPYPMIDLAFDSFLSDQVSHTNFRCYDMSSDKKEGILVKVPLYLQHFFPIKSNQSISPLFVSGDYGVEGYHEINGAVLNLLIRWMGILMARKEFPSTKEIIHNEINLEEWIHVSDYIGLDIFKVFFTKIYNSIQEHNKLTTNQ